MTDNNMDDIEDFEVLRAELIRAAAQQISAIATVNAELPVHIAAAIAAVRAEFSKDDFDEIIMAAFIATARTLNGVLPVLDRLGVPMSQRLELVAVGEQPPDWDGDLSKLRHALQPNRTPSRAKRRKGPRK